jgi:hypothetical protein
MSEPNLPDAFQSVIGLGAAKKVFRVGCWAAGQRIGSAAAILLILLLMVFFGVAGIFIADNPASGISGAVFMIAGALLAGYFLWKPFQRAARSLRNTVILYEGGLAVSSAGGKPRAFPWKDIHQVTVQITRQTIFGVIPAGTEYKLTVSDGGPDSVELDSPLSGVEELHQAIRSKAVPRISAEALEQFRDGKTVAFGPIRASRTQGLLLKNRTLAWDSIRNVNYGSRILLISPKTGGLFAKLMFEDGSIPNIDALLAICREAGVLPK